MKHTFPTLILAALVAVFAAGCGGSSGAGNVPSDGVAVVGNETITKTQFNQLLEQARKSYKAQKRPFPKQGSQEFKSLQDQALQYLVQRAEFEQKAKDLGVSVSNADVTKRLKQIK